MGNILKLITKCLINKETNANYVPSQINTANNITKINPTAVLRELNPHCSNTDTKCNLLTQTGSINYFTIHFLLMYMG